MVASQIQLLGDTRQAACRFRLKKYQWAAFRASLTGEIVRVAQLAEALRVSMGGKLFFGSKAALILANCVCDGLS